MSKLDLSTRPTPTERRNEQVQWLNLQLALAARRAHVCQRLPKQARINVDSKLAALTQELAKRVSAEFPLHQPQLHEVFDEAVDAQAGPAAAAARPAAAQKACISIATVEALPQPAAPEEFAYGGESDWFEVQAAADEDMDDADGTYSVF